MVSLAKSTSRISTAIKRRISRSQVSLTTCTCTVTQSNLNEEGGTICLQSKYFVPLWMMVFSLHVFLCLYLIGYVYIYFMILYDPIMVDSFGFYSYDVQYMNKLKAFMWSFVLIIGLHTWSMTSMTVKSFR